jgi:hypothetical protein
MAFHAKKPPTYWKKLPAFTMAGIAFAERWEHALIPLYVMRSVATLRDGSKWIHVSVSRQGKMPRWEDVMKAKDDFIGRDKEAYQVLTAAKDHVSITDCLHFWAPCDGVRRVANLQDLEKEELP